MTVLLSLFQKKKNGALLTFWDGEINHVDSRIPGLDCCGEQFFLLMQQFSFNYEPRRSSTKGVSSAKKWTKFGKAWAILLQTRKLTVLIVHQAQAQEQISAFSHLTSVFTGYQLICNSGVIWASFTSLVGGLKICQQFLPQLLNLPRYIAKGLIVCPPRFCYF